MFEGSSKPKDIDEFVDCFVSELINLIITSIDGVEIRSGNYIMDAPARSLILKTKNSPGYNSCHKCWIKGRYCNHFGTIVYEGTGHPPRTHAQFVEKDQWDDDDQRNCHHTSLDRVKLESIPRIDIVANNPIDYMHGSCQGLMKRALETWMKGIPLLSDKVDELLKKMNKFWPLEFQRPARSLKYLKNYKATEFRLWLLYLAPAITTYFLTEQRFNHFCLVHHALRLLFFKNPPSHAMIDNAQNLINEFLHEWPHNFNSALSYVVHTLEHLPEDCKIHNCTPDGFSAFPFESYLRRVKRNYHSGGKPLEQVFI